MLINFKQLTSVVKINSFKWNSCNQWICLPERRKHAQLFCMLNSAILNSRKHYNYSDKWTHKIGQNDQNYYHDMKGKRSLARKTWILKLNLNKTTVLHSNSPNDMNTTYSTDGARWHKDKFTVCESVYSYCWCLIWCYESLFLMLYHFNFRTWSAYQIICLDLTLLSESCEVLKWSFQGDAPLCVNDSSYP